MSLDDVVRPRFSSGQAQLQDICYERDEFDLGPGQRTKLGDKNTGLGGELWFKQVERL